MCEKTLKKNMTNVILKKFNNMMDIILIIVLSAYFYFIKNNSLIMKHILLPTDFSKNSINAIDFAMDFLAGVACHFYFLNVQKPSQYVTGDIYTSSPQDTTIYETISQDNKKQLEILKKTYKKKYGSQNYIFETLFDFDVIVDAINQVVLKKNISLIFMGTNGASDAAEVLFGSNTLKVIRGVHCPIIAIPKGYRYTGIKKILLTLKEDDVFHPDALNPLKELIIGKNVSAEVLQIEGSNTLPENAGKDMFTSINYHHIEGVATADAVSSFEQLIPVDIHVVFIHPTSFFKRIFFGSDAKELTYKSWVPLLVLK